MNNIKLEKLLNTQLDGNAIQKLTKSPIIKYPEFNNMSSIDDAFKKSDSVIIFFEIEDAYSGHWTCMMKRGNEIEFFDPYGLKQDDEFNYVTMHTREELNEQFEPLSKLLNNSNYKVIHNPYKIQKFEFPFNSKIVRPQTCGRHSALRLMNKDKTLEQHILDTYTKNNKLGNDDIISCYLIN